MSGNSAQIRRETLDDLGSPAFGLLTGQDEPAEPPVKADQLPVDSQAGSNLSLADSRLRLRQKGGIAIRVKIRVSDRRLSCPKHPPRGTARYTYRRRFEAAACPGDRRRVRADVCSAGLSAPDQVGPQGRRTTARSPARLNHRAHWRGGSVSGGEAGQRCRNGRSGRRHESRHRRPG